MKSSFQCNSTRECIESALIKLMEKKDFAHISITEIITKAGVSRVSYYRNYSSKEDILSKYMQSIVKCLSDCMLKYDAVTQTKETWLALLDGVKPYANQYKLLLKADCAGKMLDESLMIIVTWMTICASFWRVSFLNIYKEVSCQ